MEPSPDLRLAVACLALAVAPALAQTGPDASAGPQTAAPQGISVAWRPSGNPDPTRLSSPPFDPALGMLPEPGAWAFAVELSYFNVWGVSSDLAGLHAELGREGQPLGDDELALLDERDPGGSSYQVDLEGWRSDLVVARGFSPRIGVTLHVPWLDVGRPHWDGVAERWHEAAGLPNGDRELFPRGQTLVALRGEGSDVTRRDLAGSGLGDVSASLVASLGHALGAEHRVVASVQAPTGEQGTLRGSGGWDLGARWFGLWTTRHLDVLAGAGLSRLDRSGSLLGITRSDLWHLAAGLDWRLGRGIAATVRTMYESSPLEDAVDEKPGRAAWFSRFGVAADLGRGLSLAVDTGQDSASGLAPDFSFHVSVVTSY